MSRAEAEAVLTSVLQAVNNGAAHAARPVYTFQQFVTEVYLLFCRRGWKESTAGTSEQVIKSHLIPEFGKSLLHSIGRGA